MLNIIQLLKTLLLQRNKKLLAGKLLLLKFRIHTKKLELMGC